MTDSGKTIVDTGTPAYC